jgi:hypothetical protein
MEKDRKKRVIFSKELYENFDVFLGEVIKEQSRQHPPSKASLFALGAITGATMLGRFISAPVGLITTPLLLTWPILKKMFDDLPTDKKEKKIAELEHYRYLHNQFKVAIKYDPKGAKREMKILFEEMVKNL